MTTDERLDESITNWLEATAPSRLPERVLDATFVRTRRSGQHVGSRAALGRIHIDRFATAIGGAAAVLVVSALAVNFALSQPKDAEGPGRPDGIFADVGGWIAFGDYGGIWAVDPTRPGDPDGVVQLSSKGGTPKAWSPDGSRLLVLRDLRDAEHPDEFVLFVLNADGTETRLAQAGIGSGADFTPDGSQVVYGDGDNIFVIDAEGGTPELLLAGDPPLWTFSPDGTQIAYIDWGHGDGGHSVRVMNSDGTGVRVVVEDSMNMGAGHIRDFGLDWSPDGQHLVFANTLGVWVVGIDGSGLLEVSSPRYEGADPRWSPDGSRISFNTSRLVVARWMIAVQEFHDGRSGPWHPGSEGADNGSTAAGVTELLNGFLAARIAGEGAEQYLNGQEDVPLLYATTAGAPYERAEYEPILGIEWPYELTAFKVRLFAGDTVVEQLLFMSYGGGRLGLEYVPDGYGTEIAPTTEDGRPVARPYSAFDGEVTLQIAHPWVFQYDSSTIKLVPEGPGVPPTTDGGERYVWEGLVLMSDPVRYGTGCPLGPGPAGAEALAESIRSDPDLETTAPVAMSAGGAHGLWMDVGIAAGATGDCGGVRGDTGPSGLENVALKTGDRMRLYLFDAPEGSSMRSLAVAMVVPESDFERAVEAGAPVVSVEFLAP
jgi:hypothetical protein